MSLASLVFQVATVIVALLAAGFAWRLDRRLNKMREGQDGMTRLVAELTESTMRAESAVRSLHAASQEAGTELESAIRRAREAAEELRLMTPAETRRQTETQKRPSREAGPAFTDRLKSTR